MGCNHPWDWSCIDCVERTLIRFEKNAEEKRMLQCQKDPTLQCEGPIPEECKSILPEEEIVMFHLVKAWNTFVAMKRQHPDEESEFRHSLHDCQRIISMRILRRLLPKEFGGIKNERNSS